ncbi:hypothetical protein HOE37_04285 [Candidatus Woesearchaeota archaeon]|jgi:hypothetical protein|nr:hypothetical protein [Candidatus Woesearchaeota archaeon]MBT4111050.1 hypothetical protein [Candidatus Woesearchaeota archaeon]MBT4336919.1 hypothetical protein [Candidatus Woesearchaeota archaeon]MBT4469766.1 hypothetical protein [Candidatus Woesearchaeota archaeon]MBT6743763.1 hypothetical protein [Candidatus Woesearchaeota archaeon]
MVAENLKRTDEMLNLYGEVANAIEDRKFETLARKYVMTDDRPQIDSLYFTLGLAVCTAAREAGVNVFDENNQYGKALAYVKGRMPEVELNDWRSKVILQSVPRNNPDHDLISRIVANAPRDEGEDNPNYKRGFF